MSSQVQSCRWCDRFAKYVVSSIRRSQKQSKTMGGHPACGRHLTRAVDYVTVPGGQAHVEVLH